MKLSMFGNCAILKLSMFGIGDTMTRRYRNTFRNSMLEKIESMPGTIVLREDVDALGDDRQVSRALRALIEDNKLIRLGSGVYAKARVSPYTDTPIIRGGFTEACIELLDRLGVDWEPSQAIKDYNAGRTQQVPAQFEVRLKSRFRKKIAYGKRSLRIQGMTYAK